MFIKSIKNGNTDAVRNSLKADKPSDDDLVEGLYLACYHGHFDIVKILLEADAPINGMRPIGTSLHACASTGQVEIAEFLIQNGADVNATITDNEWYKEGETPLLRALDCQEMGMVTLLDKAGATLDYKSERTLTLFEYNITDEGNVPAFRYMRDKGMPATKKALWFAAKYGQLEMVKDLLGEVGKVNYAFDRDTLLYIAAYDGRVAVTKYLLEKGADVNRPCTARWTALHAATYGGYAEIVTLLLEAGADPNAKASASESYDKPLDLAYGRLKSDESSACDDDDEDDETKMKECEPGQWPAIVALLEPLTDMPPPPSLPKGILPNVKDGIKAVDDGDFEAAILHFEPLVEEGDAVAQFKMGCLYHYGDGVERNAEKSIELWSQAANHGHSEAQYKLGELFFEGYLKKGLREIFHNQEGAIKYLSMASENKDDGWILYRLGQAYYEMDICYENEALACWEKSAALGESSGQRALAWVLSVSKHDSVRDGQRAVNIIEDLLNREKPDDIFLETAAAVYAETGQFDKAVDFQVQALQAHKDQYRDNYNKKVILARNRLAVYQDHKPWRQ